MGGFLLPVFTGTSFAGMTWSGLGPDTHHERYVTPTLVWYVTLSEGEGSHLSRDRPSGLSNNLRFPTSDRVPTGCAQDDAHFENPWIRDYV